MVIDESRLRTPDWSHVSGDRSRKVLVEYGFRLPSAFDNRPLTFDKFKRERIKIYVSATPANYEKIFQQR